MQQRLAPEVSEDRFRKFSAELLAAEEVGFRDGFFYSPDALRSILERFCNIIAKQLRVQSCTVQLKLYDSLNSSLFRQLLEDKNVTAPTHLSPELERLWENFSQKCRERFEKVVGEKKPPKIEQREFRQGLLKDSLIFPYALYPKGALWLVASNEKGPWARCAPWLISHVDRGIMTQIIQDKAARVRDRMSLRQTRSHLKLGPMDQYIWTNQQGEQRSPLYFFNYYGVPIRIHQRGDVIGILRVENKGLGAINEKDPDESNAVAHEALNRVLELQLGNSDNIDKFADDLLVGFQACKSEIGDEFELQDISLLSLVYLAHDLATGKRPSDTTIRDLCTLPYPPADPLPWALRAPVQIGFDNSEEEKNFVDWLAGDKYKKDRLGAVKIFYGTLNAAFREPIERDVVKCIEDALKDAITAVKGDRIGAKVCITPSKVNPWSLLYSVQLDIPNEERFVFYMQVTPWRDELKTEPLVRYWNLPERTAAQYVTANHDRYDHANWQFHLPTDRLAARIEALTFAFPIPRFTIHDAWWLSWAALEIGKLIERQISYRGTHLSPTVPLTAMDFFRVPISDMSFVDALRNQYKDAETVKRMLEYHIPNHCRELNLQITLEHNCRVKDFRSYLERLGEEHRAYYDALIATWLYILYLRLDEETEEILEQALNDHRTNCKEHYLRSGLENHFSNLAHCEALYRQTEALLANLKQFYEELKKVCESKNVLFAEKDITWLKKNADEVFGDLRFAAPNLDFGRKNKDARQLVLDNLCNSPQAVGETRESGNNPLDEEQIFQYVFRIYDPFVTQAISLYILLNNAGDDSEAGQGYVSFYEKCRKLTRFLREKFESSHRLNEQWRDVPELLSDTKSLILKLELLRVQASELSTSEFSSVLQTATMDFTATEESKPASDDVRLTLRGIYKRVRTLINIAGNQVSPSLLNWEILRFDYVGARVNCLFKNQVFAIYEQLWNRGDPFSHWTAAAPKQSRGGEETEAPGHLRPATSRSKDEWARQRWLSIQTKIHKGEDGYNAWQISALMDPRSVFKGYWGASLYNINLLRDYLVVAIDSWHMKAANEYRQLATRRTKLQQEYCNWFTSGYVKHVLRKDLTIQEFEQAQDIYFPEYLLRTPLDIVIRLLENDLVDEADFQIILDGLYKFVKLCLESDDRKKLWPEAQKIYSKARYFADGQYAGNQASKRKTGLSSIELKELDKALHGQLAVLKQEESRFRGNLAQWPNSEAFKDQTLLERLDDMRRILDLTKQATEIWRKGLRHVLIELQSNQKQYLFKIENADKENIRGSQNVLERILCYILLFKPKSGSKKFKGWSAYDLFYYVSSLIPAEIQVRTALADTMAEQYHGVYKSNVDPASSVAVQRRRLQEMGRKLDNLDRETEAIYDGYIVHSMLHAAGSEAEADEQNDG
jgi:ppGpp synthetase/RelA/SpoT-type nucleotidyltranferase